MHKRSAVAYPVSVASASESGKRARTDDSPTHVEKVNLPDSWKHLTKENNTTDCPKAKDANWIPHRDPTTYNLPPVPTTKAYKNPNFLNSSHARSLRMMMEYEETMQRLAACGIKATVQFFGSARAKDRQQYDASHAELTAQVNASAPGSPEAKTAQTALERLESMEWMIEYLDKTRELARRLTEWSIRSRLSRNASISGVSRNKSLAKIDEEAAAEAAAGGWQGEREHGGDDNQPFRYLPHATDLKLSGRDQDTYGGLYVCTGGAGGFMEAANRGAADVPNGRSIGMGISLPFETGLNPYVTPELAFEYHYFFTRKLCMAFHMQALVVAPGGFGTCDEMFEMMTLKQTGKMQSGLPIVLLGKAYWRKVLNWEAFAEMGTIAKRDVDELLFTDDVDEAFDYITERLGALMGSPVRRS